jgi:outer membrane protein assembly factor BamE (lipoprotein component of BamABCDE complex)
MEGMKKLLAIAATALALLAGCATSTVGQKFNHDRVRDLRGGETTFAQTVQLVGVPPQSSGATTSGALQHTWLYVEANGTMFGVEARKWTFTAEFNREGVFQRLVGLAGIDLSPQDQARLFTPPAAR